jgi:hypothetical protein
LLIDCPFPTRKIKINSIVNINLISLPISKIMPECVNCAKMRVTR